MSVSEWLRQPYPGFTQPLRDGLLIAGVGGVVTMILLIARPFGLATLPGPQTQSFILATGSVAISIALAVGVFLPMAWKSPFRESSWSIQRQILFECAVLISIAIGLLMTAGYFGLARITWSQAGIYTAVTALFGVFPLTLKVLLTQVYLLKRNVAELERTAYVPMAIPDTPAKVELIAETTDRLVLDPDRILYVAAQQNYSEIHWQSGEGIKHHLFRQKIGAMEKQLRATSIKRTHRSFLANLDCVIRVRGNAQGYRLTLQDCEREIPLSRSLAASLLPQIDRRED